MAGEFQAGVCERSSPSHSASSPTRSRTHRLHSTCRAWTRSTRRRRTSRSNFWARHDPDAVVEAVERAVAASEVTPFDCYVAGYGVFPSLEYISVIWAGITQGSQQLTTLHEHVDRETTALGFDAEEYDFTPHATLARMRDARSKSVIQEVVAERDPELGTARVDGVELTQSTRTEAGPEYETVAEIPL